MASPQRVSQSELKKQLGDKGEPWTSGRLFVTLSCIENKKATLTNGFSNNVFQKCNKTMYVISIKYVIIFDCI